MIDNELKCSLQRRIAVAEEEKKAIEKYINRLKRMLDEADDMPEGVAMRLKAEIGKSNHEESTEEGEQSQESEEKEDEQSRSPTVAVLRFIKDHPGTKPGQIAATLEDRIYTKSNDPKTIIYTTISYLKRKGKIRQAADGGCHVND